MSRWEPQDWEHIERLMEEQWGSALTAKAWFTPDSDEVANSWLRCRLGDGITPSFEAWDRLEGLLARALSPEKLMESGRLGRVDPTATDRVA